MRIRRRPPLPLSLSQNPNFSLHIQPSNTQEEEEEEDGLHSNELNINDPSPSDPVPKAVFREEKEAELKSSSSSSRRTLDAQVHNYERSGDQEIERDANMVEEETMNGKKRRAPPVLMEGSRCSRVNGRGWRCSQQTLIGYSLCEHHLGKARLRSVNGCSVQVTEKGTRKPKIIKKEKIGTMRARSITSLLDEGDQRCGDLV